ncbi:MAG: hypothetical protein H7333_01900 [Bdellovibrionales bacterium]|nr:hypothetical protein [Oligoflexia bacterium]
MKNLSKMNLIVMALALSACGIKAETTSTVENAQKPTCVDFSGSYTASKLAKLTIKQVGCESIEYTQTCTGTSGMCSMMDLKNFTFSLPLDGTRVAEVDGYDPVAVTAKASGSELIITEDFGGGDLVKRTIRFSDHPCSSDNPVAGLEIDVANLDSSEAATVTSSTCQPWDKTKR